MDYWKQHPVFTAKIKADDSLLKENTILVSKLLKYDSFYRKNL